MGSLLKGSVRQWESGLAAESKIFSAGAGKAATDVVWRQSAAAQIARRRGEALGQDIVGFAALSDIRRLSDSVDLQLVATTAAGLGFPSHLLRAALSAYRWPRVLRKGRWVGVPATPTRGVVAGDVFAMALVVAYCWTAFHRIAAQHPLVTIRVYVDDTQLQCLAPLLTLLA